MLRRTTTLVAITAALLAAPLAASAATSPAPSSSSTKTPGLAPKAKRTTQLHYGDVVRDSLDDDEDDMDDSLFDFDAYTFTGKAGEAVTITAASDDFDTFIELYDPSNHSVAHDDDGDDDLNSRLRFTLPRDGTYRVDILASDDFEAEGDYVLTLAGPDANAPPASSVLKVDPSAAATVPVTYGQVIKGKIAQGDEVDPDDRYFDKYSFVGKAGDNVVLTVDSSEIDSVVYLFDSDSKLLGSDDDGGGGLNAKFTFRLPRDGTYRADVLSAEDSKDTGAYTFTVKKQ